MLAALMARIRRWRMRTLKSTMNTMPARLAHAKYMIQRDSLVLSAVSQFIDFSSRPVARGRATGIK